MRFHKNQKYTISLDFGKDILNRIVMGVLLLVTANIAYADSSDLYFPPVNGAWETVSPEEVGWKVAKLKSAMEYAGKQNSSGVVILYRGRIVAEQYWKVE